MHRRPGGRVRTRCIAAGTAVALLTVGFAVSETVAAVEPRTAGAIVFSSDRDGDLDLWTVDPGATPVQVANLSGTDDYPRWSPDGSRIAFIKNQNTTSGRLWVMGADGTNATQLSSVVQARFAPTWSPDGSEIFFAANSGDGDFDVHAIAPDGTGLRKLADTSAHETYVTWVAGRLAVHRGSDLVLVDPVTGADIDVHPVGIAAGYDGEPNGTRVAVAQRTETATLRIVLVDTVDGSVDVVTDGTFVDTNPAWSDDARALVFSRRATSGSSDLYTIAPDGTGLTQITTGAADDIGGDWAGAAVPPPPPAIEVTIGDVLGVRDGVRSRVAVMVSIGEGIGVGDHVLAPPVITVTIGERVGLRDGVHALPAVVVMIGEPLGVRDQLTAAPVIQVSIGEGVGVGDQVSAPPTLQISIGERLGVGDDLTAAPAIRVTIGERVGVGDQVSAPPTVQVSIGERLGLGDQVSAPPTVQISIGERLGVGDDLTAPPAIRVTIGERVGVGDQVSAPPTVQISIGEGVGVGDEVTAPPTIQVTIGARVGVRDQLEALPAVVVTIGERVGVVQETVARFPLDAISDAELVPGGSVEILGTGFAPDSEVEIGLESDFLLLQTIRSGLDGSFDATVGVPPPDALPAGFAGVHTLVAKGVDPGGGPHELRFPVTVVAPVEVALSRADPDVIEQSTDGSFVLSATLREDWGELTDERPSVDDFTMVLEPLGPGAPAEGACTADRALFDDEDRWHVQVRCAFDHADVDENTYVVVATVDDEIGPFWGQDEGVLTVADPAGGAISGGGTFPWPDAGDDTEFGFSLRTNRKAKNVIGGFALIRELPGGATYQIRSTAIDGMSMSDEEHPAWATFVTKATYRSPQMDEPEGNHQVRVYAEDIDSGADRIWVEVRDRAGRVIDSMSFATPAGSNAVEIDSGDVAIPSTGHGGQGRAR